MSEITDEVVEIDDTSRLKPVKRNVETYRKLQVTQDRLSRDLRGLFSESG